MASTIDGLIHETRALDQRAAAIQTQDGIGLNDTDIDALVDDYQRWYARALDALPSEFEERFRECYEGNFLSSRIKSFLRGATDPNILFDPSEEPNPLISPWQHPYESAFRGPLIDQRQILAEAKQAVEGPGELSQDLHLLERLCRSLPDYLDPFAKRGRQRTPFVVEDEYDLQTAFHAALRLVFDDVRPEDYSPERAGARSRVDFLLKAERIVVETKMTRRGLGAKQVGEELIADIERYKEHPDCGAYVALVYDPSRRIDNRRALEADLTRKHDGLVVRVYIVQ